MPLTDWWFRWVPFLNGLIFGIFWSISILFANRTKRREQRCSKLGQPLPSSKIPCDGPRWALRLIRAPSEVPHFSISARLCLWVGGCGGGCVCVWVGEWVPMNLSVMFGWVHALNTGGRFFGGPAGGIVWPLLGALIGMAGPYLSCLPLLLVWQGSRWCDGRRTPSCTSTCWNPACLHYPRVYYHCHSRICCRAPLWLISLPAPAQHKCHPRARQQTSHTRAAWRTMYTATHPTTYILQSAVR